MHSIATLERDARLPRRTVQRLADSNVLMGEGPDRKRVFADLELEVLWLLRPFTFMDLRSDRLTLLAKIFRDMLQDPNDAATRHLQKSVKAARRGQPAWLVVQMMPKGDLPGTFSLSGATSSDALQTAVDRHLAEHEALPVAVVDMRYALNQAASAQGVRTDA